MPINCLLGRDVEISHPDLVNLYGGDTTQIGDGTTIGPFVEIQKGVLIGKMCKIQSHAFICEGVTLEDGVFVGHGVMFINDRFPAAVNPDMTRKRDGDWKLEPILIKKGASLGSNCTILAGVEIGENALVGAGSVVTRAVEAGSVVAGNPAKVICKKTR